MTEGLNPFFQVVMDELRKRLTPEEFTNLLKECNVDPENENTGSDIASTPGQTPIPAD